LGVRKEASVAHVEETRRKVVRMMPERKVGTGVHQALKARVVASGLF
jgi:hypothetical protein